MWLCFVLACQNQKMPNQQDSTIESQDSGMDSGITTDPILDADSDGFSLADGDCDDTNPDLHPEAIEECDGIDNDCDGIIDPQSTFFLDMDGDGFGFVEFSSCQQPPGYSTEGGDCNDEDASIHPAAIDQCGDDIDQDCDGVVNNEECFYSVNDAPVKFFSDPTYPMGVGGVLMDSSGDGVFDFIANAPSSLPSDGVERTINIFHGPFGAEQSTLDAVHRISLSSFDANGGASLISTDFNGDGQEDLIIASEKNNYGGSNAGAVYLVLGPIADSLSLENEFDSRWAGLEGSLAGYSVASLGDVNSDGLSDLVIGAYKYEGAAVNGGAAYIIFGSTEREDISLSEADVILLGGSDENLGYEVASAGDLNGDGILDLAVNAYRFDTTKRNAGRTFVFFGPIDSSLTLEQADIRIDGYEEVSQLGSTLAPLLDFDGDGIDDLLVASQFGEVDDTSLIEDEGVAFLLVGLEAGDISLLDAQAKIVGEYQNENFGREAVSLGDVNNDGFGDMIISSKRYGVEHPEQGRSSVFLGPLEGTFTSGQGVALLHGPYDYAWTGIVMDVEETEEGSQLMMGSREPYESTYLGVNYLLSVDFF